MRSTLWLAGAGAALALAACGGDGDDRSTLKTPGVGAERRAEPTPERAAIDPQVDASDLRVVRRWADALRHGDVRGAARYFALPSVVANGTPPIKLETRAEVRFFNRTLPCGAKVIAAEQQSQDFLVVTFRLTERPGKGACGAGAGATARAAFRIRGHRITAWVRVPDGEPEQPAQS